MYRGGKTDDAKMANGNLNRIAQGSLICKMTYTMTPVKNYYRMKSGDETNCKMTVREQSLESW